jgi:hypothetical protein
MDSASLVPHRRRRRGCDRIPRCFRCPSSSRATHQIDLVGDRTATGRCYFLVLTAVGLDHWGRYLDDYRVAGAEWRFARRRVLVDGLAPASLFADRP